MKTIVDNHFSTLDQTQPSAADHQLVLRHAPKIRFDQREPFFPSAVGYTVFRSDGISPSFPRRVELPENAACAIEYAVWWDWDIQHLYELEHIWVYLDADENVIAADASWHGGQNVMVGADGRPPLDDDGRVILFSESGKHAFAPVQEWLDERAPQTLRSCQSGRGHLLVTALFDGIIKARNPLNDQLVWSYLEQKAFEPTFVFDNVFDLALVPLVPWSALFAWIPERVTWWTEQLREAIPPQERRVIRIAHRGASAYAQENSLAAFHKAAELGADMVEVDVRFTADGIPVIAHDENLKRVYGVDGLVGDYTLEELGKITPADREPLVTFDQLVETCRELQIGLYLDIKQLNSKTAGRMFDILDRHGMFGATIFGSFRADWLAEIKAIEPRARTSILFSSIHVDPVPLAQSIQCDYVHPCWERFEQPHTLITAEWLGAVRSAGLGVVCWHEERPAEIKALQNLGVNGICSDEPELLLPQR